MKPIHTLLPFALLAGSLQAAPAAPWCDQDKVWCHLQLPTKSGFSIQLDYRLDSWESSGSNYLETYIQELWVNAYRQTGSWSDYDRLELSLSAQGTQLHTSCQLSKVNQNRMTCALPAASGALLARKFVPTGVYFPSPYDVYTQSIAVLFNDLYVDSANSFQFKLVPGT